MSEMMEKVIEQAEELKVTDLEKASGSWDENSGYAFHSRHNVGEFVMVKATGLPGTTGRAKIVAIEVGDRRPDGLFYIVEFSNHRMLKINDNLIEE